MAEDARLKLEVALANAKARQAKGAAPKPARAAPAPKPTRAASTRSASTVSASKPAKAKPKKKKAPRKKGPGLGDELGKKFSRFATTVIDELKSATAEISPGALLASAADGLQSLKKAVEENLLSDTEDTKQQTSDATSEAADVPQTTADIQRSTSSLPMDSDLSSAPPVPGAAPESDGPIEYTSPAKVIKMSSKKKKAPPEEAQAEAGTEEQAISSETGEPEASEEHTMPATEVHEMDTSAGNQEIVDGPAAMTSPSQVQRAPSKKKPAEDGETEDGETEAAEESSTEAPLTDKSPSKESPETAVADLNESPKEKPKTRKPPPKPTLVSKTEHSVRSFRALQSILTNPLWAPVVFGYTCQTQYSFCTSGKI